MLDVLEPTDEMQEIPIEVGFLSNDDYFQMWDELQTRAIQKELREVVDPIKSRSMTIPDISGNTTYDIVFTPEYRAEGSVVGTAYERGTVEEERVHLKVRISHSKSGTPRLDPYI